MRRETLPRFVLRVALLGLACVSGLCAAAPATHPRVLLTPAEVIEIRANLGRFPLFDAAYAEAKSRVDRALAAPIDVPVPKDAAGYTHERHKQNYAEMQLAGFLYQITGDAKYAGFVRAQLERYAELYPKLGKHPAAKSTSSGRLFWQSLNETVWLVHVSQAYDCVYDFLTAEQRARYEASIFRPMTHFLCDERIEEFDRIHNHGTWTVTAVGLIGYAMGDDALVDQALRGSKRDGSAGYFRQLDELFSPDGFYCEGPYYARYALMPFFVFAQAIENNQPERKVFAYRDSILRKALEATLQQTYVNGEFIPINDALKEKTYHSPEVVLALDTVFRRYGRDAGLLGVAAKQGAVVLSEDGLEVARALAANPQPADFQYRSVEFTDGGRGDTGGLAILRSGSGDDQVLALLKYTAFGMEHGHYDKLQFLLYDQGREIIPDYGAARFLNIEQKTGGRYLPENTSFAKQTIAHNTLTVDERTHYRGSYDTAEHQHSDRHYFSAADPDFQYVSARDTGAVPGVAMQRTLALVRDPALRYPVVIDVLRATSLEKHRYDLPYYYQRQFLQTNVALDVNAVERPALGSRDGYQHLWIEASGSAKGPVSFTWLNGARFYSITAAADEGTRVFLVRSGANDPKFNLRHEPALLLRREATSTVFAAVIEPHGQWDATREFTIGNTPQFREVRVLASNDDGTVVRLTGEEKLAWTLLVSNRTPASNAEHTVSAGGETFTWSGPVVLRRAQP